MNGLALVAATVAATLVAACGQFDEVGTVRITNDSQQTVRIVMCGNTCKQSHDRETLNPGESTEFNATQGGPSEDFRVEAGDTLRCLSALLGRSQPELRLAVSAARPCTKRQMRNPSWWDKEFG